MDNTNIVVLEQQRETTIGFIPVMILCGIVALIVTYFWHIVVIAGIAFTGFVLWMLWRDQQLRARELAVRADEQNRLYLAGDQRGVFGDEGSQR